MTDGTVFVCPMHPAEIRRDAPGTCPKRGMALEPEIPSSDDEKNPEFVDFRRRLGRTPWRNLRRSRMKEDSDRKAPAEVFKLTPRVVLLACGPLYAVLYPIVNDVIAATLYDGYSRMDQAVSELSATGAPTHALLAAMGPVFNILFVGFGIGVWQSAHEKRSLRLAGALMIAHAAMGFLWMFAPMSQRDVIAAGGATSADTMHLILSGATGLLVTAYVATAALAFGWAFRLYSIATIGTALLFGLLSAQVDKIEAGEPTPCMGLLERIGIGAWLLWVAVVAIGLIHRQARESRGDDA